MKFSELSTDKAADVLCEITPYINNIVSDKEIVGTIGKVVSSDGPINKYGNYMLMMGRVIESIPLLLKTHRPDVYGILSVMYEKPIPEIADQKLMETMRQARELLQDEEFTAFFKSFGPQGQSVQSAPSAASHG